MQAECSKLKKAFFFVGKFMRRDMWTGDENRGDWDNSSVGCGFGRSCGTALFITNGNNRVTHTKPVFV